MAAMFRSPSGWRRGAAVGLALAVGGALWASLGRDNRAASPQIAAEAGGAAIVPLVVAALGRLEPEGEVIRLAAPVALDGDRLAELRVREGDRVRSGQIVAVLDSQGRLAQEVQQAKAQVAIARARLAQIQAGAKSGEIAAQKAAIARLNAELGRGIAVQNASISRWESEVRIAEAEYERFQRLSGEGVVSPSSLDSKRLAAETARAQWREAVASRDRLAETLQAQRAEAQSTLERIAEGPAGG
ncbi:MAG: biotin/lipoyl-binding protein [Oscillatoriales cyanobacterium SM2_1_8]|nr:biotin/lipoyl-binding protein [Oscillatoriales cyanobacterium SM2_1_8]